MNDVRVLVIACFDLSPTGRVAGFGASCMSSLFLFYTPSHAIIVASLSFMVVERVVGVVCKEARGDGWEREGTRGNHVFCAVIHGKNVARCVFPENILDYVPRHKFKVQTIFGERSIPAEHLTQHAFIPPHVIKNRTSR